MTLTRQNDKKSKWLNEGYKQFAEFGPDQISINKISKDIGAARASFYHFFGDMDVFIEELCALHWDIAVEFNKSGKDNITQLFPDFYDFLAEYNMPLQFSLQLFRNRHHPTYNYLYLRTYELSASAFLLDLFAKQCHVKQPKQDLLKLWVTVGEAWYSRLDPEDLSSATMQKHAKDILQAVMQFSNSRLFSSLRTN